MCTQNISSVVNSGIKIFNHANSQLNVKYYTSVAQSIVQHPVVVGYRVVKDIKHCVDVLPGVCKGWHNLYKLLPKEADLSEVVGDAHAELVKLRVRHKVVAVTGSFFCIIGGLGQFFFRYSPPLYILARLVDLVGLGLLLAEPIIAARLHKKEGEAGSTTGPEFLLPNRQITVSIERQYLYDSKHDGTTRRMLGRENTYAQFHPLPPFSCLNTASHACYFVARTMHLVALCALISLNKELKMVRTGLETVGLILSVLSTLRTSYVWVVSKRSSKG